MRKPVEGSTLGGVKEGEVERTGEAGGTRGADTGMELLLNKFVRRVIKVSSFSLNVFSKLSSFAPKVSSNLSNLPDNVSFSWVCWWYASSAAEIE